MKTTSALLSAAFLAAPAFGHVAIKPPSPDKALTPNSSTAPAGCKLLASDKGFPADDVWAKAFPDAFRKLKGTEGPDYWVQAKTVKTVQTAVNFAREHNVRLSVISSGHDFMGREDARSGLRIDMAALMRPTVFSNDWKCGAAAGAAPKVATTSGRPVDLDNVIACKTVNEKRDVGRDIPQRKWEWHYFEKRAGHEQDCNALLKRHLNKRDASPEANPCAPVQNGDRIAIPAICKRHGPEGDEDDMPPPKISTTTGSSTTSSGIAASGTGASAAGAPKPTAAFTLPPLAEYIPQFNTIKPEAGKQQYAKISAGVYNELFYVQADKSGLMTLGAQHGGVNVLGGWAQAGGHNPFAHEFGMQVDNIVEFEVVTPDGKFQTASECSNPDLYWALRGGGGSTFGIVTGGTIKVFPTFPITVARFFVNATAPYSPGLFDAAAHFLQVGAKLRDQYGIQGYFYIYPNAFHSVLHFPGKKSELENVKKAVEPLMAEMEKLAGAKHNPPHYYPHKSYKDWYIAEMGDEEMEESGSKFLSWYDGGYGEVPAASDVMMNPMLVLPYALANQQRVAKLQAAKSGKAPAMIKRHGPEEEAPGAPAKTTKVMRTQPMGRTYLDSRLLSDRHVNSVSLKALSDGVNATFPRFPGNHIRGFLYGGGKMAEPKADAMGLLPAWRNATYHFIINAVPGDQRNDYNIHPIDKLFPDAGGYVNEASHAEPNWKEKYWGANYPKLETLKKKYDPNNVLWCSPCVGADMFTYDDERICKNPSYPQAGVNPQAGIKNDNSKTGIASLPGEPGIPNPLMPIIQAYMQNKTLPKKMPASPYFKMAMGQGGSSGGKWSFGPPANTGKSPAPEGHGHGGMDMEMDMGHGAPKADGAAVAATATPLEAPTPAPVSAPKAKAMAPLAPAEAAAPAAEAAPAAPAAPAAKGRKGRGRGRGKGRGGRRGRGRRSKGRVLEAEDEYEVDAEEDVEAEQAFE